MPTEKNKYVAAILAFCLGMFGVQKFYLGLNKPGIILLLCGTVGWILILPGFAAYVLGIVEAVVYATKSDEQFAADVAAKKEWL
jgi:TM2 domain-containing membrane protein YozV